MQVWDELAKFKQKLIDEEEDRLHPKPRTMPTVQEYALEYLEIKQMTKELPPSTIQKDKADFKHVTKASGSFMLDGISPAFINKTQVSYRRANNVSLNVLYRMVKTMKLLLTYLIKYSTAKQTRLNLGIHIPNLTLPHSA